MTETDQAQAALQARIVALTRDLMLIPSDESRPEDIERGIEFIKNHLEALSQVDIAEYRHNGNPSIVALPKGIEKPDVLLCGHVDVISHNDTHAYRSHVEDGRIYGPGSGDMKGPLAILMELFRFFHSQHEGASLGLAITSDEERGGESGVRYLFEDVGLRCGTAMIPDGGSLHQITVEEKGIIHLRVRSEGRSAHAARPWLGDNPLSRLTKSLVALDEYFESLVHAEDRWYPTCALTILGSSNHTINCIPADAEAILDVRFPPPYTYEGLISDIERVLGKGVDVEVIIHAEPTHLSPDDAYVRATTSVTDKAPIFVKDDGGSDARFICQYGIPVMVSRPLMGQLHSEGEWIDIKSMMDFHKICEIYLKEKLGVA